MTKISSVKHESTGFDVLHDPALNKGTAFTEEERDKLGIRGLLPPRVFTQEEQDRRVLENFNRKGSDLQKYIFLMGLQDRNENLFYETVINHITKMMPIIYTPTVGTACKQYAHIYRRPRGLYITAKDRGRIGSILNNWYERDVGIIVVTDGERILGLGDLGANGMGIPVGKLSLYTACAGIPPELCLPITIDVGTNNKELLNDGMYIGLHQERLRGEAYDELIEEFVTSVQKKWPRALIQFEDFANRNAFRLLEKYQKRACVFNDDIQGTASVALAGLIASKRITGKSLKDKTYLFLGAGSAAKGIADLIVKGMMAEGLSNTEAKQHCWFVDSKGLVVASRTDLQDHKLAYAHEHEFVTDLFSAVKALRPDALIGVSGQPQTFTKEIVQFMAADHERPVIFALSNPTSKAEATAKQVYNWSDGGAIFASGSPFDPVTVNGKTHYPGQGNNSYIFPGVGLGVVVSRARTVPEEMFYIAAETLAHMVTENRLNRGSLYPPLDDIRNVSAMIATKVARYAFENGLNQVPRPDGDLEGHIRSVMYQPKYQNFE